VDCDVVPDDTGEAGEWFSFLFPLPLRGRVRVRGKRLAPAGVTSPLDAARFTPHPGPLPHGERE
jgi:hypothetical protein